MLPEMTFKLQSATCCFLKATCCLYLDFLRPCLQRPLHLADDGISLSEDAAVSLFPLLLLLLDVPTGITNLLELQRLPSHQHLQALDTHKHTHKGD